MTSLLHLVYLFVTVGVLGFASVTYHGATLRREEAAVSQQRRQSIRRASAYGGDSVSTTSGKSPVINLDFQAMNVLDDAQWLLALGNELKPFWQQSVKTELQTKLDPFFSRISRSYSMGKVDFGFCTATTNVHYDFGKTTGLGRMDITQLTLREGSAMRVREQRSKEEYVTTWSGDFQIHLEPTAPDTVWNGIFDNDLNTRMRHSFVTQGCSIYFDGGQTGLIRTAKPRLEGLVSIAGIVDESQMRSRVNVTGVHFPEELSLKYDDILVDFDALLDRYGLVKMNLSEVARGDMADEVQKKLTGSITETIGQQMKLLDVRMPLCFEDYFAHINGSPGSSASVLWSSWTSSFRYGWADIVDSTSSWLGHQQFRATYSSRRGEWEGN